MWHSSGAMVTGSTPPSVSILLPTLNEREYIRDAMDSLAAQDYANIVEVLVIDGGSTDGTVDIALSTPGIPVRLLENPAVTAAGAMNRGLASATGEVIVRVDAHALYARDYVRRCVEVLAETGAANVGGRMRPVGTTSFGRAVAAVTSSPFGVGPGRFHYAGGRSVVETVYLGCWRAETLRSVGGWDERRLQWAAEDQELNFRLRQAGGVIVLDESIRSWYFPRGSFGALRRQYFNYGMAKASTLAKHRRLPYWRPLAPAGMVVAAFVFASVPLRRFRIVHRLAIPGIHVGSAAMFALRLGRSPGVRIYEAWLATITCHWFYGAGFWAGVYRLVSGVGFQTRPSGHR